MAVAHSPAVPPATINGESLQSLVAVFALPAQAHAVLVRHGLPTAPQAGHWYPLRAWLDVLAEVAERFGDQTLYAAGLQLAACSVWPPDLRTLPQALRALTAACRLNIRGADTGEYRVEALGPTEMQVLCATPAPREFEHGLLTGLARKFKPPGAVRVRVTAEPPVPGGLNLRATGSACAGDAPGRSAPKVRRCPGQDGSVREALRTSTARPPGGGC